MMKKTGAAVRLLALLLLLAAACGGGNGRENAAGGSEDATEPMNNRYAYPFANPQLNSLQNKSLAATGELDWKFQYNETELSVPARFILPIDERRALLDFTEVFFAVNLPHQKTLGFRNKSGNTFVSLDSGSGIVFFDNFQLVRVEFDAFKEQQATDYFVSGLGQYSELHCLHLRESTFVAGVQSYGHPPTYERAYAVFEKPYTDLSVTWMRSFEGVVVPSPIGPEGQVIVAGKDLAATVSPAGEVRELLSGEFSSHSCSVGPDGTVYLVWTDDAGSKLTALTASGDIVWEAALTDTILRQPPVVRPDGGVCLVKPGRIEVYRQGELNWYFSPESESPLVTATADGHLLMSDGINLVCLNADGDGQWVYEDQDGDEFVTPPVVDAEGGVLAASNRNLVRIR